MHGARQPWQHDAPVVRVRGRRLQALRRALFAAHPLCVMCEAEGRTALAKIRDHIAPLAEGNQDQPNNGGCQGLCQACSDAKTHAESMRGQRRKA